MDYKESRETVKESGILFISLVFLVFSSGVIMMINDWAHAPASYLFSGTCREISQEGCLSLNISIERSDNSMGQKGLANNFMISEVSVFIVTAKHTLIHYQLTTLEWYHHRS